MVQIFDNMILEEERVFLLNYVTKIDEDSQHTQTMHKKFPLSETHPEFYKIVNSILSKMLPQNYIIESLVTFDNKHETKIHSHGPTSEKCIDVNLMLDAPPDDQAGTVFFDNYTNGCAYSPSMNTAQIINYKDEPFPENLRKKICNFLSPEVVYGLTLQECVSWRPGRIMTFSRNQLHCGQNGAQDKKFIVVNVNLP